MLMRIKVAHEANKPTEAQENQSAAHNADH